MTDYSPPNTFYSQLYGLFENEDMYQFIGKNGAHFKYLTSKLNIDYIWWNKETNIIELWGPHYKLTFARKIMQKKLDEYMKNKADKQENTLDEMEQGNIKKFTEVI
jgi:phosphate starvation-inducible protein PhoH